MCQIFTTPSSSPDAKRLPLADQATQLTRCLCPSKSRLDHSVLPPPPAWFWAVPGLLLMLVVPPAAAAAWGSTLWISAQRSVLKAIQEVQELYL
jgi:hypothetical protein